MRTSGEETHGNQCSEQDAERNVEVVGQAGFKLRQSSRQARVGYLVFTTLPNRARNRLGLIGRHAGLLEGFRSLQGVECRVGHKMKYSPPYSEQSQQNRCANARFWGTANSRVGLTTS